MQADEMLKLLNDYKDGLISQEEALEMTDEMSFKDLGIATIDNHRAKRTGYPEVIYCEGKTIEHVITIIEYMMTRKVNILGTRASKEMFEAVHDRFPEARYNELGRTIVIEMDPRMESESYIAIVCAGTSDLPVVEEAYETAKILGNKVEKVTDVGVAGIHRLFARMDVIKGAKVVIVVAGMEGALASVVGGIAHQPVIAVPTSVGYGANFGGVAALLSMLNSCASGVTVVNIDNGFGAAYSASMINQL